ncbi:Uncharacterized protein ACO02O_02727 [Dirofilaria immitis]
MGGYNEAYLFAQNDPFLIRTVAIISVIFIFVELYLRLMTKAVYMFISETKRFRFALDNSKWRYRKRVYFSYCSIMQQSLSSLGKSQSFPNIVGEISQSAESSKLLRSPKQIHYNWRTSCISRQRQRIIKRRQNRSRFNQAGFTEATWKMSLSR